MSRLYWRIFVVFWLVLLLTLLVTFTINTLVNRDELALTRLQSIFASMDALAGEAQQTLDADGEEGLRAWLTRKQADLGVPMMILRPDGKELLGRRFRGRNGAPDAMRHRGDTDSAESRKAFGDRRHKLPPPRALIGPEGEYTLFVIGLDRNRILERWLLSPDSRRLFPLFLVLISGGACLLLARYLTQPIQLFREAGQQIAAGNLGARVGPQATNRKDEFGALARDFDSMAEQVETSLNARQRLLRDVSHELRSPLARLQAAVGLIRQKTGDAPDENLDRIEREAHVLDQMIGQVLAFSRLESLAEIAREPADVGQLVSEVVENARFEATAQGKQVTLEETVVAQAKVDSALVLSAVDNVVRNAVQHSRETTLVAISFGLEGIGISVSDDGPGVPDSDLDKLTEPFFTANPSNSAAGKGAGIGLAIARRAVELHGGSISFHNIDDEAGKSGLKVVIRIPLVESKA